MSAWDVRPNGDLEVSVLRSLETAVDPSGVIAIRIEHQRSAGVTEAVQIVMSPEDADMIGRELAEVARLLMKPEGKA